MLSFSPGIESALPLSHTPLQQAIHWLFECWWRQDLKGKEELGWTAFLVCLENTVTLEKPVLEYALLTDRYDIIILTCVSFDWYHFLYCRWAMLMLFGYVPRSVSSEGSALFERCFSVWTLHLKEVSRSLIHCSSASSGPLISNKKRFVYICVCGLMSLRHYFLQEIILYNSVYCSFFRGNGSLPSFFLGTTTSFGWFMKLLRISCRFSQSISYTHDLLFYNAKKKVVMHSVIFFMWRFCNNLHIFIRQTILEWCLQTVWSAVSFDLRGYLFIYFLRYTCRSLSVHVAEIYFRAWRKASGPSLEEIESTCIQDLMQHAMLLHRNSPVHSKVRQVRNHISSLLHWSRY